MHQPIAFAFPFAGLLVAAVLWPSGAKADEKEACLASADMGQSLRDDGHYMIARDQFLSCAREVCPKLVHDQCTEWLRQLDEAVPTVVFGARDQHGNDITAARVLSDGKLITSSLDGKPVALDPGPHDLRFERDPEESVTVHVVLRTGEKNREVSAAFPASEGTPAGSGQTPMTPGTVTPDHAEKTEGFWNARAVTSLSLLVAGAAAVGVGAYFGVQSRNEKDSADATVSRLGSQSACRDPLPANRVDCNSLASARDSQNSNAILNEALYITGGVLAAGALASWVFWPKAVDEPKASTAPTSRIAPTLGPSAFGVRLEGAF